MCFVSFLFLHDFIYLVFFKINITKCSTKNAEKPNKTHLCIFLPLIQFSTTGGGTRRVNQWHENSWTGLVIFRFYGLMNAGTSDKKL